MGENTTNSQSSPPDSPGPLPNLAKFSAQHRQDSIVPTLGREGAKILPKCYAGKAIAVFTSGGDSQGRERDFFESL